MKARVEVSGSTRRSAAIVAATTVLMGCATLHPAGQRGAVETALQGVCGSHRATSDSTCVVRDVTRIAHGYRVVIDRHPPAGNDRVAVVVRPAGVIGGSRIEVRQLDTASTAPHR
jgi:hypothetical protein